MSHPGAAGREGRARRETGLPWQPHLCQFHSTSIQIETELTAASPCDVVPFDPRSHSRGREGGGRWVCMTCVCAFYSLWHERWWACPPSLSTASSATPSSVWEMTRQKHRQSIVMFYIWFKSDYVSGLPITLLQQVAFLLTAKLFVPLQLVHTVAPLLTLGVLCKPQTHIFNTKADFIRTLFLKKKTCKNRSHTQHRILFCRQIIGAPIETKINPRQACSANTSKKAKALYCQAEQTYSSMHPALTLLDLIPDKQKAEGKDRGERCERVCFLHVYY